MKRSPVERHRRRVETALRDTRCHSPLARAPIGGTTGICDEPSIPCAKANKARRGQNAKMRRAYSRPSFRVQTQILAFAGRWLGTVRHRDCYLELGAPPRERTCRVPSDIPPHCVSGKLCNVRTLSKSVAASGFFGYFAHHMPAHMLSAWIRLLGDFVVGRDSLWRQHVSIPLGFGILWNDGRRLRPDCMERDLLWREAISSFGRGEAVAPCLRGQRPRRTTACPALPVTASFSLQHAQRHLLPCRGRETATGNPNDLPACGASSKYARRTRHSFRNARGRAGRREGIPGHRRSAFRFQAASQHQLPDPDSGAAGTAVHSAAFGRECNPSWDLSHGLWRSHHLDRHPAC